MGIFLYLIAHLHDIQCSWVNCTLDNTKTYYCQFTPPDLIVLTIHFFPQTPFMSFPFDSVFTLQSGYDTGFRHPVVFVSTFRENIP